MQVRAVDCVAVIEGVMMVLPDEACNTTVKPEMTRPCTLDCEWVTGPWGEVSQLVMLQIM